MQILPSRYLVLKYILDAYNYLAINVPLVCYDGSNIIPFSGTQTSWTGSFDDIEIFVVIPKLIKLFNLSLQQGIDVFFYGLLYIPFILAFGGFLVLYKSWLARLSSGILLVFLLYSIMTVPIADVYLAYSAAPLSIIPLFLYFLKNKSYVNLPCFIYCPRRVALCSVVFRIMCHWLYSYYALR